VEVGAADDGSDLFFGLAQGGDQNRQEDADDRNNDQQFDQREGRRGMWATAKPIGLHIDSFRRRLVAEQGTGLAPVDDQYIRAGDECRSAHRDWFENGKGR
jgi:hypothetical protein